MKKGLLIVFIITAIGFAFLHDIRTKDKDVPLFEDKKRKIELKSDVLLITNKIKGTTDKLILPDTDITLHEVLKDKKAEVPPFLGFDIPFGIILKSKDTMFLINLEETPTLIISYPMPPEGGPLIIIYKSQNLLYFYIERSLIKRYPVSTGVEKHYTPEGNFSVVIKAETNGVPEQFGARWMGLKIPNEFDKREPQNDPRSLRGLKYGIHGTNEPSSIGKLASGGCIRMHNKDIEELFDLVPLATKVIIRP